MKKIASISVIALLLFASCNNTKLLSSWKSPDATTEKYNKVLVLGLTGSKDRELRESVENAVAKKLQDQGLNVETSTHQYGPKSFRTMSEEQAVKMVNDNGFDAVMVVALLDKKQERNYTPGYTTSTPYAVVRNRWYGGYSVLYDRVYNPGYYSSTTDYVLEASFYKTKGDRLIYSAQTKSFDPNSAGDLANEFSKTIVSDMRDKGVISK
ncbi:hypothetical protein [Ferruginibacter sp.]